MDGGVAVGTLEASYAERLISGDRFVLDGRVFKFRRLENSIVHARPDHGEPNLPRWTSDRQSLSFELAQELAVFREEAARRLVDGGPGGPSRVVDEVVRPRPRCRRRLDRAFRGAGAMERGSRRVRTSGRRIAVAGWRRLDLYVSRPPAPRGVRGAWASDRGPAGPAFRAQPGPVRRRPGLVDSD